MTAKEDRAPSREGKQVTGNAYSSDFKRFRDNLEIAAKLHSLIKDRYHANTYAYYASDPEQPAWNEVHWKIRSSVPKDPANGKLVADDLNGSVTLLFDGGKRRTFRIQEGTGKGDGTVPAESAESATKHVIQMFKHGGKANGHDSYEHQYSYNAPIAQSVCLYSIVKMVAESDLIKHAFTEP